MEVGGDFVCVCVCVQIERRDLHCENIIVILEMWNRGIWAGFIYVESGKVIYEWSEVWVESGIVQTMFTNVKVGVERVSWNVQFGMTVFSGLEEILDI